VLTATADVERISSLAMHARADVLCARVAGRHQTTCRIANSRGSARRVARRPRSSYLGARHLLVFGFHRHPSPTTPPTLSHTRPWLGTLAPLFSVRVSPCHTGHPWTYLTRAVRRTGGGGAHSSSTASGPIRHRLSFSWFSKSPPRLPRVNPADVEPNSSQAGHARADIFGARVEGPYRTG